MEKEFIKEAVKSAKDELRSEEKTRIKNVVKTILEQLQKKEESRKVLDDEIRIIRKDLEDLKDGRLDKIKERQDLDPKAKDISIIIIKEKIIEKQIPSQMWYYPWIIEVKPQYFPYTPIYGSINGSLTLTTTDASATINTSNMFTVNNSATHMYTSGTYLLDDGTVKYL